MNQLPGEPYSTDWKRAAMTVFDRLGRNETKLDKHETRLRTVEQASVRLRVIAGVWGMVAAIAVQALMTLLLRG